MIHYENNKTYCETGYAELKATRSHVIYLYGNQALKLISLAVTFFTIFTTPSYSNDKNIAAPTTAQIIDTLFKHQNSTFNAGSISLGQNCDTKEVGCLLRGVLIGLAQDSYSKATENQDKKWSQHAWSKASCKLKDRDKHIKYVSNNSLYKKSFALSLRKLKAKVFWECKVEWGVAKGNIHWSQELRFSLTHLEKKLIKNSFAAMNTP